MVYVVYALLAHVGNAFVFILDKSLLTSNSKISEPMRMVYYTGISSLAMVFLFFLPHGFAAPTPFVVWWSLVSGSFFLGALWFFYSALKQGEPSRVVPITGSAVPLFTLIFAVAFLGEQLGLSQVLGVLTLIGGGALLSVSWRGTRGISGRTLALAVVAGAAFAANFATVKYMYAGFSGFLPAFVYSRLAVAVVAIIVIGPLLWLRRPQMKRHLGSQRRGLQTHQGWLIAGLFISNKALGAGTFLLQNYAISLGSVTVVNALQGTQYLFLIGLAMIVSRWWPQLWREEVKRVALWQKLSGVVLIGLGLILIV